MVTVKKILLLISCTSLVGVPAVWALAISIKPIAQWTMLAWISVLGHTVFFCLPLVLTLMANRQLYELTRE